jgi:hypothetical protein
MGGNMAEKKTYKVTKIGPWGEPVKVESRGKTFTNVRCTGKLQGDRESEAILQVGSTGMAQKMKVGESYVGKAVMKDEASGLWVIAFAAADNESLAAPKKDFGSGGSGFSGGGSRNPDDGIMACACGFVKSKIEAGAVADNEEIVGDFRFFFNQLKAFCSAKNSDPDTKAIKEEPVPEDDIPF